MEQMDHFHAQHIQENATGCSSFDFPQSQELFSNPEHAEHHTEGDIVVIAHESDMLSQNDNSLFQDQIVCEPTRTQSTRGCKKLNSPPDQNKDSTSSDYTLQPRKHTLKEIFDIHFRRKREETRIVRKSKRHKKACKNKKRKAYYSIPLTQRKRRLLHRGIRFPFASKKHLSLKFCFAYEQYVLGGFLNYIKTLKYDSHLQKSLKNMEVGGEQEEILEMRKFKYLDDEEPISPISESGDEDEHETEYCDAQIVENSSFILSCKIPSQQQWRKKKEKRSKADDDTAVGVKS